MTAKTACTHTWVTEEEMTSAIATSICTKCGATKTENVADIDSPTSFDVDLWIDDVIRPEVTVNLYPHDATFAIRLGQIEVQIPAAEAITDENRGMDDPSPDALRAQLAELRAEREAAAFPVRVRELTNIELDEIRKAAVAAGAESGGMIGLWQIAAACVEPKFTVEQLDRLRKRDRSGEAMVGQLLQAVAALVAGLPVPSLPAA